MFAQLHESNLRNIQCVVFLTYNSVHTLHVRFTGALCQPFVVVGAYNSEQGNFCGKLYVGANRQFVKSSNPALQRLVLG